jgi:hypothetical protein
MIRGHETPKPATPKPAASHGFIVYDSVPPLLATTLQLVPSNTMMSMPIHVRSLFIVISSFFITLSCKAWLRANLPPTAFRLVF